jgi:hypothetical protein
MQSSSSCAAVLENVSERSSTGATIGKPTIYRTLSVTAYNLEFVGRDCCESCFWKPPRNDAARENSKQNQQPKLNEELQRRLGELECIDTL